MPLMAGEHFHNERTLLPSRVFHRSTNQWNVIFTTNDTSQTHAVPAYRTSRLDKNAIRPAPLIVREVSAVLDAARAAAEGVDDDIIAIVTSSNLNLIISTDQPLVSEANSNLSRVFLAPLSRSETKHWAAPQDKFHPRAPNRQKGRSTSIGINRRLLISRTTRRPQGSTEVSS